MTKPIPSRVGFLTENEKGDPKGRLAKPRKLVPEARVELARRETTVFETAASAIPPLGHISLHSITEARIRVYDKIASRPALLFRTPQSACTPRPRLPYVFSSLRFPAPRARSSRLPAFRALLRSLRPPPCLPASRALARRPVTCVKFSDTKVHPGCPRIACPPRSSSSHPPFANSTIAVCSRAAHWGKVGAIATRPRRLPRGRRSCGRD